MGAGASVLGREERVVGTGEVPKVLAGGNIACFSVPGSEFKHGK